MRIWLVTVGEPWPTDGNLPRLHRTGSNAGFFAGRNHEVTSWSGTFDHASKTERKGEDVSFVPSEGYTLIGIFAGSYERNVSLKRIAYHRRLTQRFKQMVRHKPAPDIVVVSLTPLELARAAVEYGKSVGVPVIVDVRDMWPDIWAEQLPASIRPMKHIVFAPFYNDLKHAVRGATAIVGITEGAIDWALTRAGRARGPLDRAFPLASLTQLPAEDTIVAAERRWRAMGIGANPDEIVGCFFGSISKRIDFTTPLDAMISMPEELRRRIKLVLCGRGECEELVQSYTKRSPQIIYPGWVDAPEIAALMRLSKFGLLPYPPSFDFMLSLPNKVFDYLRGGLPIVTSLRGEVERLFSDYSCGALYNTGGPASFAAVLERFVSAPDHLAKLTVGAKLASQAYDPAANTHTFEGYLENVVSHAKSAL